MTQTDRHTRDGETVVESPPVSAVRTAPGRTVFTEDGNEDGWMATDHTVDVER